MGDSKIPSFERAKRPDSDLIKPAVELRIGVVPVYAHFAGEVVARQLDQSHQESAAQPPSDTDEFSEPIVRDVLPTQMIKRTPDINLALEAVESAYGSQPVAPEVSPEVLIDINHHLPGSGDNQLRDAA